MVLSSRIIPDSGWRNVLRKVPSNAVLYLPCLPEGFHQDTVKDFSGQYNNGTRSGATWKRLRSGLYYPDFDGDDFVGLGDILDSVTAAADAKFSFHCWVKPNATMTANMILGKYYTTTNQRSYLWRLSTGSAMGFYWNSAGETTPRRSVTATTAITNTAKWYCLDMTYDGSIDTNDGLDRVKFYVDAVLENTTLTDTNGALGDIFDGTAHLGWGVALDTAGATPASGINAGMILLFVTSGVRTQAQITNRHSMEQPFIGR